MLYQIDKTLTTVDIETHFTFLAVGCAWVWNGAKDDPRDLALFFHGNFE